MTLITGPLDIYDYLMFAFVVIAIVIFFSFVLFLLGLPGKIALQRRHPHAETVKWMGWAGFLVVIPWIHALIWAFHDSLTIDIRRFPAEEKEAIEREMARLGLPSEDGDAGQGPGESESQARRSGAVEVQPPRNDDNQQT